MNSFSCQVTYTDNALGSPTITAAYSAAGYSQGKTTLKVSKATPTAYASCQSLTVGSTTTCTAEVLSGYNPSGTVSFSTSDPATGKFMGSPCTLSSGSCNVTYTDIAAGSTITATYSGDSNNNAGIPATTMVTLNKASPVISVSCPQFTAGSTTTCTATLSSGFNPSGTVSFNTSDAPTGAFTGSPCTLSSGSCHVTYTDTAGSPTITATYSGDGNNNAGIPVTTIVKVNKASPILSISCPSFTIGSTTTCTATLSSGFNSSGTVSFNTTDTSTGTFTGLPCILASGSCHVTYTDTAGSPKITAAYSGDSNNNAGNPVTTTVMINKASPIVSVSCPPSTAGSTTTCTATVASGYDPSGAVTFYASDPATGKFTGSPCILSSGSCNVLYTDTAGGLARITATYSGDSNNNAGNPATIAITVTNTPVSLFANALRRDLGYIAVAVLAIILALVVLQSATAFIPKSIIVEKGDASTSNETMRSHEYENVFKILSRVDAKAHKMRLNGVPTRWGFLTPINKRDVRILRVSNHLTIYTRGLATDKVKEYLKDNSIAFVELGL